MRCAFCLTGKMGIDRNLSAGEIVGQVRVLVRLLNGIKGKVNLLPLNEAAGIPFERPSDAAVNRFARILSERGVTVSVRRSRGRDIRAACGQLITESSRADAPGRRLAMAMGSVV
jgi:adenine C2-methylase RlmN of 23S rRNA A2503 and tRNA A37